MVGDGGGASLMLVFIVWPTLVRADQAGVGHGAQLLQHGLADPSVFPHDSRRGGLLCHWARVLVLAGENAQPFRHSAELMF